MHYINLIQQEAFQNKYTNWYVKLCERAAQRSSSRKAANKILPSVEAHHVYPTAFEKTYKKDKNNIVFLTIKEHYIAHLLLIKMFAGVRRGKMAYALLQFGRKSRSEVLSSKKFEFVRKIYGDSKRGVKRAPFSEEWKRKIGIKSKMNYELGITGLTDNIGENNGMFGKTHSNNTKKKMSEKKRDIYNGSNNPMFGKTHSEEIKQAQSERAKGTVWINNGLESKKMKLENAQQFLANGWNRGRAMDHRASEKYLLALLDREKPIE